MEKEFKLMLDFVEKYFFDGFKKGKNYNLVFWIRFESIFVGVVFVLREEKNFKLKLIDEWLNF